MQYLQSLTTVRGAFLLLSSACTAKPCRLRWRRRRRRRRRRCCRNTLVLSTAGVESHLCHCGGQSLVLGKERRWPAGRTGNETTASLKAIFLWLWCKPLPIQYRALPLMLFCWTAESLPSQQGGTLVPFTILLTRVKLRYLPPSAGGSTAPMDSWVTAAYRLKADIPVQVTGLVSGVSAISAGGVLLITLVPFTAAPPSAGGLGEQWTAG